MRNHNSQSIGFYTETLVRVYHDMVSAILPHNEIERDAALLRTRSSNEGMSFLTKTLPSLGKSIDVSLANGTVLDFSGFRSKADTNLPRFMYELFSLVFRDDGVPWFATWYSDYSKWDNSLGVVDQPLEADGWSDTHLTQYELFGRLKEHLSSDLPGCCVGSGRPKGFPGQHTLNEIGLTSHEVDHISLGFSETLPLLISDNELNPRREAMVVALRVLRQVCFIFYKLNIPYTDEQETKTLVDFVETDTSLDFAVTRLDSINSAIHSHARQIICHVLANARPDAGVPRHGPGAVATGEKLPDKHLFKRFYRRLDAFFSYPEWFFCNHSHVCDSLEELQSMEVLETGTAKVVLVPKDSRGPRLISCEPLEYQWVQQSLMQVLVKTLEGHRLTRGRINFSDQTVNRRLALESSRSFEWVTLDMKEASDRVSCELVKSLFNDIWWNHLYASRSGATQLPDGTIVQLNKFAPMGSAVCFPVEALIFWALAVSTLMVKHALPLGIAVTKVYVYGDDIICDATYHGSISNALPNFGLMLNKDKCCVAGPFKESCGEDAFFGASVTPTRIRATWCPYPEPSMLASYVEYSNVLYRSGQFQSAIYLENQIQSLLKRHKMRLIPVVSNRNPSCIAFVRQHEQPIARNRENGIYIRFHADYQRHEVQGYRLESKLQMAKTYGWPFLLRLLAEMETKKDRSKSGPNPACSMLTGQYPIAHRTRLKRAWTSLV